MPQANHLQVIEALGTWTEAVAGKGKGQRGPTFGSRGKRETSGGTYRDIARY